MRGTGADGARSSVEVPVMGMERRGPITPLRRRVNPAMGRNPTGKRDQWSGDKSRMRRESPVRFREGLGGEIPPGYSTDPGQQPLGAGRRLDDGLERAQTPEEGDDPVHRDAGELPGGDLGPVLIHDANRDPLLGEVDADVPHGSAP